MQTVERPTDAPSSSATATTRRAWFTDERETVVVDGVKIYGTKETRRTGLVGAVVATVAFGLDLVIGGGAGRIHPTIIIAGPIFLFACLWLIAVAAPAGTIRYDLRQERFETVEASWWWNGLITSVFVGTVIGVVASLYLGGHLRG